MQKNVHHAKVMKRWCDTCGTLLLGERCSECSSNGREFEINGPGDIRPCMGSGVDTILKLFEDSFGTCQPIEDSMIFLNKIAGDDRSDEIISRGAVIGVMRFNVTSKGFDLELRQAGAELFAPEAKKNVVTFSGMSGHLKGKTIPGSAITSVEGEFEAGEPIILKKGNKVGPGISLSDSRSMTESEKAVKVKDLLTPSGIFPFVRSDRRTFVRSNTEHLSHLESTASSDIRSFIKGKNQPVTVSFSGGKDSLAALGVTLKVIEDPVLMFIDTGIEFPHTVKYVKEFADHHKLKMITANAGNAFWNNVSTFGPPAKDFRWCCKVCKLGPLTDLISQQFRNGTITIEGNRWLESFSRSNTSFVSKNPFVPNQTTLNPIRKWNASEVWGYIWMKDLEFNPLYEQDLERIGCYLCASCLSSEWESIRTIDPGLYERWNSFLKEYATSKGLPEAYADMGFWRWKVLPPKMVKLAEGMNMTATQSGSDTFIKMVKGASPCAAGGYSMEAIVSIPRKRDFSAIEDSLRTIGHVRYSDDFEMALLKTKKGTAKLFGGGQVSIVSDDAHSAEYLFERSVRSLLRSQMCTECGICVKACRKHAIRIDNGFHADVSKCTSCGICEDSCMVMHYYNKIVVME